MAQQAPGPARKITLGVLAHVDAGKTTLSEALLYRTGELRARGRVDHGDSFLDGNAIERNRGITVFSKQARLTLADGTELTLLDTPGHVDFSAEMERTLAVLDYAMLIISASDGVQSHTETLWRLLRQRGIPTLLFINKMDLAVRDRETILQELSERLGPGLIDFTRETDDEGFLDDLTLAVPELMEKVLAEEPVTDGEIAEAIRARNVFPCVFGSALKMQGIDRLLEVLGRFLLEPSYLPDFAARAFKISRDANGERLTFLRILGGSLQARETLRGSGPDGEAWEEKVHQIRLYSGMKFRQTDRADAGTVCAVTGLTRTLPGDGLGALQSSRGETLEPFLTYTLQYPAELEPSRVLADMRVLEEEDPKLHVEWHPETGRIGLRLMGQVQMEVLTSLIAERFGYPVTFGTGQLIYLETIADTVEGVGHFEPLRHYAEVHLILEPGERGSGLTYDSIVPEDVLLRNWQRLILSHLTAGGHIGVLAGAPITDMRITLAAGRAHEKHTGGGDFREATYRALRNGLREAKSILLEPWFAFRMELPSAQVGRAMTDLRQMGGRFELKQDGDRSVLTGSAPAAGLLEYPQTLTNYTGGQGRMSCHLSGYEECHNTEEVLAAIGYDPDRDTEHPADSVFVSHGATSIVRWDEVHKQMHLPFVLRSRRQQAAPSPSAEVYRQKLAADKELQAIFERTYGPVKRRTAAAAQERETRASVRAADRRTEEERQAAELRNREIRERHQKSGAAVASGEPALWVIDGYNLINSDPELLALGQADIGATRQQLLDRLVNFRGYTGCEMTVVFDAYKVPYGTGSTEEQFGVRILYTAEKEPADIRIGTITAELGSRRNVTVVSSDALVQQNSLGHGAYRMSSREFMDELRQVEAEIREKLV